MTLRGNLAKAGAAAVPALRALLGAQGHLGSARRFVGGQGKTKDKQQGDPGSNAQKSSKQAAPWTDVAPAVTQGPVLRREPCAWA